eukprot:sb/3475079/
MVYSPTALGPTPSGSRKYTLTAKLSSSSVQLTQNISPHTHHWIPVPAHEQQMGAVTIWEFGGLRLVYRFQGRRYDLGVYTYSMSRPNTNPNPGPNPTRALTLKNFFQHRRKHPDFNVFQISTLAATNVIA